MLKQILSDFFLIPNAVKMADVLIKKGKKKKKEQNNVLRFQCNLFSYACDFRKKLH